MSDSSNVLEWDDPFSDSKLSDLADALLADNGDLQFREALHDLFDPWVKAARQLAARDAEPNAGTSAYEMVAATAQAQVQTTETLIHMVAATVLMKMIERQGDVVVSGQVSFSPFDMDQMHRRYEMTAKHDGLLTVVSIKPRPDEIAPPRPPAEANLEREPESLMTQDEPEAPAKAQAAPHVYDRPLWATRIDGKLYPASSRERAEAVVERMAREEPENVAQIENRFCYHDDCPASGCLRKADAEVASDD